MKSKHVFFIMIGVVILSVGVLGSSVYFGNKILASKSTELKNLRLQGKLTEAQKIALAQAKNDLKEYESLGQIVNSVVPKDKDQAKTVREINQIAAELGINIAEVRFPASNLGTAPPRTSNEEGEQSNPDSPPPISQAQPVKGINGVYSIEIVVSPGGSNLTNYRTFLAFLERLENNRRTAHVAKVTITPKRGTDLLTFSLTLNVYVKP